MSPDLEAWLLKDEPTHFVVAAVERVLLGSFDILRRTDRGRKTKIDLAVRVLNRKSDLRRRDTSAVHEKRCR